MGDRAWVDLVARLHAVVRDALERWRGVENDTARDGFYATFADPLARFAALSTSSTACTSSGSRCVPGFTRASARSSEASHAGITVTIGSRIADEGRAVYEVLVSRTVKDLTAGSGFSFEDGGEHELKGVPDLWHLYRVAPES